MKTLLWLCPETATAEAAAVRDRYSQLTRIALSAAANGFAGLAASEHHWRTDGYCPDAMGLLTGIGALVRPHILMSAIIPLPFWDPRVLAAARTGLGWISDPRATSAELAELARTYRDNGGTGPVVIMRDAHLGDDETDWLERALADHGRFWATPRQGLRGRVSPGADAIERNVLLHGGVSAVEAALQRLRKTLDPDLLCLRIELPNWQDECQTVCQLDRWRRLLTPSAVERETA